MITNVEPQRHRELRDGKHHDLTQGIIGSAIEVHKALGPGLLESVYESCLKHELSLHDIPFQSQVQVAIHYKDILLASDLHADFIVDGKVVVELKAVEALLPIHRAQTLTYMRLAHCEVGLLINFNVEQLIKGIERFAL